MNILVCKSCAHAQIGAPYWDEETQLPTIVLDQCEKCGNQTRMGTKAEHRRFYKPIFAALRKAGQKPHKRKKAPSPRNKKSDWSNLLT